jgi:hypothetical protein
MRKPIASRILLAAAALAVAALPAISTATSLSARIAETPPAVQEGIGLLGGSPSGLRAGAGDLRFDFPGPVIVDDHAPNSTSGLTLLGGAVSPVTSGKATASTLLTSVTAPGAAFELVSPEGGELRFQFTKPVSGIGSVVLETGYRPVWGTAFDNDLDRLLRRVAAAPVPAALPLVAIALVGLGIVGLRRRMVP